MVFLIWTNYSYARVKKFIICTFHRENIKRNKIINKPSTLTSV